jgi:hypothetical protein
VVTRVIDAVQPDVGLEEVPEVRRGMAAAQARGAHVERDQPDVADTVEDVGTDTRGQVRRDETRLDRPVQERQVGPPLVEQRSTGKLGGDRRDAAGHGVGHVGRSVPMR